MTQLHSLPKSTTKSEKRVGRGAGSGKGFHTSGRGQKGQKARTKIHIAFMGTKVKKSLLQRLPLMRGKGKFKSLAKKKALISLSQLNTLEVNSEVTEESLREAGILSSSHKKGFPVKVVGNGELTKKLHVKIPVTSSAKDKIESVGGTVQ